MGESLRASWTLGLTPPSSHRPLGQRPGRASPRSHTYRALESLQILSKVATEDPDGHSGSVQPFIVLSLPLNLWGQDILSQMGVFWYSPSPAVTHKLLDQGLFLHQGLGKNSQGHSDPIIPMPKNDRHGLGFDGQASQNFLYGLPLNLHSRPTK